MVSHIVSLPVQSLFDSMSVKELNRAKKLLEETVKRKIPDDRKYIASLNINDFVEFKQDYVSESDLVSINQDFTLAKQTYNLQCNNKTKSLWLSRTNQPYSWKSEVLGKTITNQAVPISTYKNIETLMDKINDEFNCELNSCLIQYYPAGESGLRIHDDFEYTMDQEQSIVVVSSGATRDVQYFHNYQKTSEKPLKTVRASSRSLYIMKPKCQEYFRHRVPSDKSCKAARFSLSFRRIIEPPKIELTCKPSLVPSEGESTKGIPLPANGSPPISPVKPHISYFESLTDQCPPNHKPGHLTSGIEIPSVPVLGNSLPKDSKPDTDRSSYFPKEAKPDTDKDIVILFGTSMTRWLDSNILSNEGTEFINCSKSGARVNDIFTMVDDFGDTNIDRLHRVRKVIFSLGTNDIKIHRQQIGRFKQPLYKLIEKTRRIFGENVYIYFQSVIPMRNLYTYTIHNFLGFNNLLKEVCRELYCFYFDCFEEFLDYDHFDYNRYLFADHLHLNRRGYTVLQNCIINNILNVDENYIFAPSNNNFYKYF